ncbi:OprD family outer membrane porin [Sulfurospirillum diekertiae]|uniref:Outer membrane porin, OprD family n=1 Tax=Sulfurospirillum diekertiae TaxID=1854492 RepID=A0A1Y0HPA8_9BACT|nr:OprD family outer membrane porin [Sulfurospirillum diekertiae]ARU49770.1 hypothetical protein Sdiek1_2622 [Sulfurospirillum diekertiae]ASC94565.1 hypothetical protein Sdiek2_2562 [Sulfurospirillum diekertiae]
MRLAKLSLVAIVVAGLASSAFAASTTLEDAFKNGKVSGELRAYYFSKTDSAGNNREDLFTTGILLNYKTDTFYGLGANFTAQGNASPFATDADKVRFNSDEYGTGAVLSEAYLSYTLGKTTAQIGRMFIDTPLVSSSGSRMTKEAFEGVTVVNTDLPNTTLIAGYVQKFQSRTDGKGNVGKFTKSFATGSADAVDLDNGAYTLVVINKSIPGLTLTGAYAYADVEDVDGIHLGYVEALYTGKAGDFGYTLAAQDYYNSFKNAAGFADDSINAYGLKAGLSFKGLNGYVAYSKTSNDDVASGNIISGLGNGADLLYTDPVFSTPGYQKNTDTYAVDLNYDITAAANVGARYVESDFNDNTKGSYTSLYASYKFDGALKNFKLGAEFESKGKDKDGDQLRFKANYKF